MKTEQVIFRQKKDINKIAGAVLLGVVLLFLMLRLFYHPYMPEEMDITSKLSAPSVTHWFGCDNFGRDIFVRVQQGVMTTFVIATISVAIGTVFGTALGALTGYFGKWPDRIFMSVNDVLFAFPSILLALLLISIFGTGTSRVVWALGIAIIPSFAKMMRGEFIKQREMDYVNLARVMGISEIRIIFVHILPNTLPVLKSCILIAFNNAILAEAGMSYLGIGVQPPTASLGRMLSEAQTYLKTAPWYTLAPGIAMVVLILAVTLLGEGGRRNRISEWKKVRSKKGKTNAIGSQGTDN